MKKYINYLKVYIIKFIEFEYLTKYLTKSIIKK